MQDSLYLICIQEAWESNTIINTSWRYVVFQLLMIDTNCNVIVVNMRNPNRIAREGSTFESPLGLILKLKHRSTCFFGWCIVTKESLCPARIFSSGNQLSTVKTLWCSSSFMISQLEHPKVETCQERWLTNFNLVWQDLYNLKLVLYLQGDQHK